MINNKLLYICLAYFMINILPIYANNNIKISNKNSEFEIDSTTYSSVGQNFRQRYIILHYTALDDEKSIEVLTKQEVSAHFLITDIDSDPIYNLVPEDKRAWHAGSSEWKTSKNLNDSSIGIEIVNAGLIDITTSIPVILTNDNIDNPITQNVDDINIKTIHEYKQNPYTDIQIKKIANLILYLSKKYEILPENILGHSDIAPQRKVDPGPMFPWKELYENYSIGMWYDETTKNEILNQISETFGDINISTYQNEFKKFGYSIEITGIYDTQTKNVIKAFQCHFRQEKYDGVLDLETYAILKALNQKYLK